MEPSTVRFFIWIAAVAVTWISARAILEIVKSHASENAKAVWISISICAPIIGPLIYWLISGGFEFSKGTPEDREASLKSRVNRNESGA